MLWSKCLFANSQGPLEQQFSLFILVLNILKCSQVGKGICHSASSLRTIRALALLIIAQRFSEFQAGVKLPSTKPTIDTKRGNFDHPKGHL